MENCKNGILKIVEMFRKNYYYIIICNSFYYPLYEKESFHFSLQRLIYVGCVCLNAFNFGSVATFISFDTSTLAFILQIKHNVDATACFWKWPDVLHKLVTKSW